MTDKIRNLISNDFSSIYYEETPANPTENAVNDALELSKIIIVMVLLVSVEGNVDLA